MGGPDYSAWHYAPDASVRLIPGEDDAFDVHILVGAWSPAPMQERLTVRWSATDGTDEAAESVVPASDVTAVDDTFTAQLRALDDAPVTAPRPLAVAPYRLALARTGRGNRYTEAVIRGVPPGTVVRYTIGVQPTSGPSVTLGPYSVLATAPGFTAADVVGGRYGDLVDPGPAWIGHVRRTDGITHVRVDLDDIPADGPLPVKVRIGGTWLSADYGAANPDGRLPVLDWPADTVTFSWPDPHAAPVAFDVGGRRVAASNAGGPGRARLLIAHFCIQAINDLLEEPFSGYTPPRTYMQVTMADEGGHYSSRPGAERINPGGYRDGLTMHRRFGVPYHLALNGGVLVLTAHDCPDDLAAMRADVAAGLLHPAIAGYGSHRIPYYSAEANVRDITAGVEAITTYLGPGPALDVFYPDQRLYRQRPATVAALQTAPVRYVVLDSATGYYDNAASVEPAGSGSGFDLGPGMLWTDRASGAHVLFIDTTLKDQALGANLDPNQPAPWKPPLAVRRRFLRLALDPHLRERTLLTYGDDFEKACNNGWFEPVSDLRERWAAFLAWVAAHRTWLSVVTTADLDPARDAAGTIDVLASIDATLDPGGLASVDLDGNRFHYDTWERRWRDTPAYWLGDTLGGITDRVENALRLWPDEHRDQLYDTAWLAFLMAQHENAWNMQALEGDDPNVKTTGDPEEFTIVEGLQVRNALVWLAASVWATWAGTSAGPEPAGETFVDGGPVIAALTALPPEIGLDTQRLDGDPNPTIVLYNAAALVVLDRNGGRVTHAFVLRDGVPRTVSGTFKSYQYRDAAGVECDGHVLQNTVWTPNHRYLGSDVGLLTRRRVDWTYSRPVRAGDAGTVTVGRIVPDNFNAYACGPVGNASGGGVRCTYERGWAPAATTQAELVDLWRRDGRARRAGTTDRMTWHEDTTFTKTFTLDGTTLRIDYTGVTPGHVVDNELCVDLWAGAHEGGLLTRAADPDGVTVSMPGVGAARVTSGTGCALTPASRAETFAQAEERGGVVLATEFLTLHRVLTEAVQVRATARDFSYTVELNARAR